MAFLIRSDDGRTSICTSSAAAAASHVERLLRSGFRVAVTDVNGRAYDLGGLHQHMLATRNAFSALAG